MRAIVIDDEPIMLSSFMRIADPIEDLEVVGQFQNPDEALAYAQSNEIQLAFLDVVMPNVNGIELALRLRDLHPDIIIVFITAYEEYIRDSNRIGGDYYIVKPYRTETLEIAMERIRLLARRQRKHLRIKTFGRFTVLLDGSPVKLQGKAKEILALVVTKRGREISNEEIYRTIWENRSYSNQNMSVYYNALRRLKHTLKQAGVEGLLVSTPHGQMVDTTLFDCDYYEWLDGAEDAVDSFCGEFLSEYSWGEYILGGMVSNLYR